MGTTRAILLPILALVLVLFLGSPSATGDIRSNHDELLPLSERKMQIAYTEHDPIVISNNSGFSTSGFSGYGNVTHPYVLDGANITYDGTCINISDVSVHFVIRNCMLTSSNEATDIGILLHNTTNGLVESCLIFSKTNGVKLQDLSNCSVHNNTLHDNVVGAYFVGSHNCTLRNNIIYNNTGDGVVLAWAYNCILANNTIYNLHGPHHGILLKLDSWGCTLINNSIYDNQMTGVWLWDSHNCTITSNNIHDNGGSGVSLSPASNITLTNNNISGNGWIAVYLSDAPNCTLTNNTVSGNHNRGIHLNRSDYCRLTNNNIHGNSLGGVGLYSSINCVLSNNTIREHFDNHACVYLRSANNCTLTGNIFSDNSGSVFLHQSENIRLTNNIINNNFRGVHFTDSNDCTLTLNEICGNPDIGVLLDSGSNNSIFGNRIGWNSGGNAEDTAIINFWDDGVSIGNSWGDYSGTGTYLIPGSAGSVDNYPSKADTISPTSDSPEDIEYEAGSTGNDINWTPLDDHPKSYLVFRNGTVVDSGDWSGTSITVSVDGLSPGVYNFTLVAYDTCYNSVSYAVLVTVVDTTTPTCNQPPDMEVEAGSAGNIITWTPLDFCPVYYEVFRDGTVIVSEDWDGSQVTISVDGLGLGTYIYTLSVFDTVGYSARDTVIVVVVDTTLPTMDRPIDISYEVDVTGNSIAWHPTDLHPASYSILRNGSMLRSGGWDGSAITIDVDGLSSGVYNYTLIVEDTQGNWAFDTVFVTVTGLPLIPMTTAITAGGIGLILFLTVVFVMKRKRRPKELVLPLGPKAPIETKVQALRGCEAIGGRFEYKVKVKNDSDSVITNVTVSILAYPEDCMDISGPSVRALKRIGPGGFMSPQFIFTPTKDCVEGKILATVSYIDYQDQAHMLQVEPYTIRSVCDLLTPLESSLEEFYLLLKDMAVTSEEITFDWNPEVLFVKAKALLPAKNFYVIESKDEIVEGQFRGTIRGFAEGKYTRKRVAVQLVISGPTDATEAKVVIEGLSDDIAMLPTTIDEIAKGIDSWTCMNCGAALNLEEVTNIKDRKAIECRYCRHTMTLDLYRK